MFSLSVDRFSMSANFYCVGGLCHCVLRAYCHSQILHLHTPHISCVWINFYRIERECVVLLSFQIRRFNRNYVSAIITNNFFCCGIWENKINEKFKIEIFPVQSDTQHRPTDRKTSNDRIRAGNWKNFLIRWKEFCETRTCVPVCQCMWAKRYHRKWINKRKSVVNAQLFASLLARSLPNCLVRCFFFSLYFVSFVLVSIFVRLRFVVEILQFFVLFYFCVEQRRHRVTHTRISAVYICRWMMTYYSVTLWNVNVSRGFSWISVLQNERESNRQKIRKIDLVKIDDGSTEFGFDFFFLFLSFRRTSSIVFYCHSKFVVYCFCLFFFWVCARCHHRPSYHNRWPGSSHYN